MRLALTLAALVVATSSALAAERSPVLTGGLDAGWWVVVGTGPAPSVGSRSVGAAVKTATAQCGYEAFNDFSDKFLGFANGFEVFVVGAFKTRDEAQHHLSALKPCVPSAYLKFGRYAGE